MYTNILFFFLQSYNCYYLQELRWMSSVLLCFSMGYTQPHMN